jgi:hypothetical protein
VLLMLTSKLALADPAQRDPVAARALFVAGKGLLDSGDWKSACEKFEKSQSLDPNVSTLIKIARCREQEGRLATAWVEYERALSLNREKGAQRRSDLDATIHSELAVLKPRIPTLRIVVVNPPSGLVIRRNDRLVQNVVLGERLPVDVGEHRIAVEAPGYRSEERTVLVREGKPEEVSLRLIPDRSEPPATPEPMEGSNASVDSVSPRGAGSAQRITGFAAGGAGIATLGLAGYFGLRTLSLVEDSNPYCRHPGNTCDGTGAELRNSASRAQTTGFILAGVGTGLLVTGGVLLLTTPSDPKPTQLVVSVGPASVAGIVRW